MLKKKNDGKNVSHLKIGQKGEKFAEKHLKKYGYKILNRNWFNKKGRRLGEIDIIAEDKNGDIIFVEVKARKVNSKEEFEEINPEDQITLHKMNKLQRIAEAYIERYNLWDNDWQFDAVSVIFHSDSKKPKIEHFKNIFF